MISAIALANADQSIRLNKNDELVVEQEFMCRLLAGTYYFSSAISKKSNNEWKLLSRVTDALVFKVQKLENSMSAGIVNLEQIMNIRKIEK